VFATDLDEALTARGWDVNTVALVAASSAGLDVPVLGESRLGLSTLRRLRSRAAEADVVVAHGSTTLPATAIATLGVRTPFVYRQISDSLFWAPSWRRRVRVRAGLRRARRVVALWEGAGRILRSHFGVSSEKIRIIPNGVPTSSWRIPDAAAREAAVRELGLKSGVPVVAFVGALTHEKGPDLAVETVRRLEGTQLLMVGAGPEEGKVRELLDSQLSGRAVLVRNTTKVWTAYAAADVLLFSSRGGDSMPAVVIEASLCGVPVVATNTGALSEMIVPGRTGQLVERADPDALAEAVRLVLELPGSSAEMGRSARAHFVDRFDIGSVATAWARVLEDAAGRDNDTDRAQLPKPDDHGCARLDP
jgi:glycosyltransferase involved in cell wall biosynthesis